jgi:putative DNA primase/helicase
MERYNASEFDDVLPPEPEALAIGEPFVLPDLIPAHAPGRNDTLWRYGRSLKAKHWKLGRILAELERVNAERCVPPLSADELSEITHNIFAEADRPAFTARRNGHHADRPLIPVSGDLAAMTPAAWAALTAANEPPILFVRGTALPVRLEMTASAAMTRVLSPDRMRHALARASRWERTERTKKGTRTLETLPPIAVVLDLLATPAPPLPGLDRIVTVPTFTPAGRVRMRPGYDPDGRAYFAPPAELTMPEVPAHPTPTELGAAVLLLLDDYLGEFPFTGLAERAHALALLLLPFMRELIDGPTPLHLVEAPTPGTGKTLLVDACNWPALGHATPAMAEGRDDDEWRKRITAKLLASAPVVFLDNLRRALDSSAVSSAITATLYEDRILGRSEVEAVPVRCVWTATGNNPRLSLEMARRTVRIRLDAKSEEPWRRTGFRHADIRAWAQAHRGRLIAAALTLGQGWLDAGRPGGVATLGMFESWARVLGGVLTVAGVDGFLENLGEFYQDADLEGAEIRVFLAAWWTAHAEGRVTAADLVTLDALPGRVAEAGKGRDDRGRPRRLGNLLSGLRDRIYRLPDGLTVRVEKAGEAQHLARWRLKAIGGGR